MISSSVSKLPFLLTIMYCFFCFGQNSGPNANALQQVFTEEPSYWQKDERQKLVQWQERILVHVDKNFVKEEESLFFKAYVLTGPNRIRATISKVLKVELLDDQKQVLRTQYHEITDGMAVGAFVMPKKLNEGEYTLRAYTRWMQNYGDSFYSHTLLQNETASSSESIDKNEMESLKISFYPEGNQLIEQLDNWLLIKATMEGNQHLDIKGQIIDENNEVIVAATAYGEGLTSVVFNPQPGKKYRYRVESGQTFDLPPIQQEGYALKVNNLNKTDLDIQIATSPSLLNSKVWIKGEMSGITYFKKEIHAENSLETIEVPKEGIPFGIMTIAILNQQEEILAERPVSIKPSEKLTITLMDSEINKDRDEMCLKFKVTDQNGNPVKTQMALSITNIPDGELMEKSGYQLKAMKGNEAYGIDRRELFKEDLRLLTSEGSRKQKLQAVPTKIKFPFQEGLNLFGYAYNLNNELLRNTAVQIIGSSANDVLAKEIETDDTGLIKIENLQLTGETDLIFRTAGDESASRLVKFVPFQEEYDLDSSTKAKLDFKTQKRGAIATPSPWEYLDSDELVELEEVEVVEEKLDASKSSPWANGVKPSKVIYQDMERPRTLPQLFLGVPGMYVANLGGLNPTLRMPAAAGQGPVLWVIDGMPMMNQDNSLLEVMNIVSFIDVDRVEILFGPEAAVYGSRASGGAILVYTRSASNEDYVNRKEGRLKFQGYHQSESFNTIAKTMKKQPKKFKDRINTIFWDPMLNTNKAGEVSIKFDTPIPLETILVKASSITETGAMGSFNIVY